MEISNENSSNPIVENIVTKQTKQKSSQTEKIVGTIMLLIGLIVIIYSAISTYFVFTGKRKPPVVFSSEGPSISIPNPANNFSLPEGVNLPSQFSGTDRSINFQQRIKLLPDEIFNGILNISIYYMLMFFITSVGFKIASLGIKLTKDITVVIKDGKIDKL